jgi:hypothetical protein
MKTYLGEDPETQEALEFLWLAERGEVTHYEVCHLLQKKSKTKSLGQRSEPS